MPRKVRRNLRAGLHQIREAILKVLGRNKKPLKPIELRDKVLASGYATSATPQSLYTAVFNTARKERGISKTKEGFQLKKGRASKSAGKKRRRKKKTSGRKEVGVKRTAARRLRKGRGRRKVGKKGKK